jgi:hypothetical protein
MGLRLRALVERCAVTEAERAKRVAELDTEIQQCDADVARYEAANQPEKGATAANQREALRKLRAELLGK